MLRANNDIVLRLAYHREHSRPLFDEICEQGEALLEAKKIEPHSDIGEAYGLYDKMLLDSPMKSFTALTPVKRKFTNLVRGYFAAAVEQGEIPAQPFTTFLSIE